MKTQTKEQKEYRTFKIITDTYFGVTVICILILFYFFTKMFFCYA